MTTKEDLIKEGLHPVDVRGANVRIDIGNLLPILLNAAIAGIEDGDIGVAVASVTYGCYPMTVRVEIDKDGLA